MMTRLVFVLCWIALLCGCAPQIPNRVTADEYQIYSAWATARFAKNPPDHLYFSGRTGVFDPSHFACGTELEKSGVSSSLAKQLRALGDAEYSLGLDSPTKLQIPWNYKQANASPDLPPGTFHLITFSRVAFNRSHTEALFAVFDACAFDRCGHGGYIEGIKQNEKWGFRPVGCWILS